MKDSLNMKTEEKPLVSFIITYYNEPVEMLRQCIESILGLSLSEAEREIVLVDDGSDVCPLNEIYDFIDRILYVRKRNGGISMARNLGLQTCSGRYIQFVDADDYLIRNAYEHCLDLVRYHNPDIVSFHFTNKHVAETPFVLPNAVSGAEYLRHNNLCGSACTYVFRSDLLHTLRFTPGILHEDEEFTPLLFLKAERIITTNAKAYFYRTRHNSITHQKENKRHYLKRLADTELVIYHLQEKTKFLPEAERTALERRIAQLTMDYLYNTIRLTKDWKNLQERTARLYDHGLFPLPLQRYTKKYYLFARMSASKIGLRVLFATIAATK